MSIPVLGVVSSPVPPLGLQDDGGMQVPDDGATIGWYEHSPAPGTVGPTVLAGHVSWNSEPAVFFDLGRLQPGDSVSVTRADGVVVEYEVTGVRQYPKDDFPTLEVYGNTEDPQLRLITCGGEFDRTARSHRDNVVVYARLADVVVG